MIYIREDNSMTLDVNKMKCSGFIFFLFALVWFGIGVIIGGGWCWCWSCCPSGVGSAAIGQML